MLCILSYIKKVWKGHKKFLASAYCMQNNTKRLRSWLCFKQQTSCISLLIEELKHLWLSRKLMKKELLLTQMIGELKLIWFIEQQWLKWISAGSTYDFKLHHGLPLGISWSWWNSQSAPFLTTEESQVEHLMDESFLTTFCLAISEWNDKWSTNSIYQIFHLPLDWIFFLFKKRFSLKCSMEWLNNMCIQTNIHYCFLVFFEFIIISCQ